MMTKNFHLFRLRHEQRSIAIFLLHRQQPPENAHQRAAVIVAKSLVVQLSAAPVTTKKRNPTSVRHAMVSAAKAKRPLQLLVTSANQLHRTKRQRLHLSPWNGRLTFDKKKSAKSPSKKQSSTSSSQSSIPPNNAGTPTPSPSDSSSDHDAITTHPDPSNPDLPGYKITEQDRQLTAIFGDYIHSNDGTHLDGGVQNDPFWQKAWKALSALPSHLYQIPEGEVGIKLVSLLAFELNEIMKCTSNS